LIKETQTSADSSLSVKAEAARFKRKAAQIKKSLPKKPVLQKAKEAVSPVLRKKTGEGMPKPTGMRPMVPPKAPSRSKKTTGQKRLKEVKQAQKMAKAVEKKAVAMKKKVAKMELGPRPAQQIQIQKQAIDSKAVAPLKKKVSSPRVDPSIQRAIAKKAASKPAPRVDPSIQRRIDAMKMKSAPTKASPENYDDLIKKTGTARQPIPGMVMTKPEPKLPPKGFVRTRPTIDEMVKMRSPRPGFVPPTVKKIVPTDGKKVPIPSGPDASILKRIKAKEAEKKSESYMEITRKTGTSTAMTPMEQVKEEKKVTKKNMMKRQKQKRIVAPKPFVHGDMKVETKVDPKTKVIEVKKKLGNRVIKKEKFTPKEAWKANVSRRKMEAETIVESKKMKEVPMKKKIRDITVELVIEGASKPSGLKGLLSAIGITLPSGPVHTPKKHSMVPVRTSSGRVVMQRQTLLGLSGYAHLVVSKNGKVLKDDVFPDYDTALKAYNAQVSFVSNTPDAYKDKADPVTEIAPPKGDGGDATSPVKPVTAPTPVVAPEDTGGSENYMDVINETETVAPTAKPKIWSYEKTNPYYDPSGKGFEKGTKRYSESSYEQQVQKMLAEKQPAQEEPAAKTTVATEVAKNEQFQQGLMTAAIVGGLYYAATKR
tara:strand:+ start:1467 stop:3419 length:1953 start_codon:yes stop_codon:yes gene_type:complete